MGSAQADIFNFTVPPGSTDAAGDPVAVEAVFETHAGSLDITLRNLLSNSKDVHQNLSDLSFTIAAGLSSGTLTGSSGLERTVAANGSFTDGAVVSTGWQLIAGNL